MEPVMKRLSFLFTLMISSLGLAACQQQRFEWNQKLTVVVDTPDGLKSGSAVTKVVFSVGTQWPSGNGLAYGSTGEATMVEVAPRTFLFALQESIQTAGLSRRTWEDQMSKEQREDPAKRYAFIQNLREQRTVPEDAFPRLVTFTNLDDPKSVTLVDPKNLAATFGPGFSLRK
jgi:hypothetical protein